MLTDTLLRFFQQMMACTLGGATRTTAPGELIELVLKAMGTLGVVAKSRHSAVPHDCAGGDDRVGAEG